MRHEVPGARGAARAAFVLALLAVLALPGVARAQILKVGYVDSVRIFANYSYAKEAQQRFTREIEAWRAESDDRRKAIDQARADLKERSLALSEEKRVEQEGQLSKLLSDYDQFVQAFWGPKGRASELNEQLTAEVIQKVRDVVERVAHDDAYDLVLDAADGNVIFAVKSLDLTDRVLEILNREAGTTTPAGTSP
jgi:outer membrane protein